MLELKPRKKGLQMDRAGILINNHLFPPESFATAYIGSQTDGKLLLDLETIAKRARLIGEGKLDLDRTPLLKSILFESYRKADPQGALAKITEWVTKKTGKGTFITQPAAMELNSMGEIATRSTRENISMKIRSRTEPKSHKISLYNAAGNNLEDFAHFEAQGGPRNTEVTRRRGTHWSATSEFDAPYLDSLTPEQRAQYSKPVGLIEYTRAAALISFYDALRLSTLKIGGGARAENISRVLLPWQFRSAPEFAFEVVARQYATKKALEAAGLNPERPTDAQMDRYLLANSTAGFVSEQALNLLELGIARRSATACQRHFPDESWAIIQAFEKHMIVDEGREFSGYSLEFRGTRYETLAPRFEFPSNVNQPRAKSAVILYDDNFELPFIMYKTRGLNKFETNMRLGCANPTGFVNISSDRRKIKCKPFQEWDWTTRTRANETIFEPTHEILQEATNIVYKVTGEIRRTPQDWRGKYISLSRQRRFKVEPRSSYL